MSRRRDDAKRNGRARRTTTDPTTVPGTMAGPGGPYDRNAVALDASNAVLLDHSAAAIAHITRDGQPAADAIAITLAGKVNQRDARAEVLFLTDLEGAAAVVAELFGVAARAGLADAFARELDDALERMPL